MAVRSLQLCCELWMWHLMARNRYGKTFRCKRGKYKGKIVKYKYPNGRKSGKSMVLHRGRKRRY